MSCGKHHDVDCEKVLARLAFFLDHELAGADADEIRQHLEECRPCLDMVAVERTYKTVVARGCVEPCPDGLRDRVLVHIRSLQVQLTQAPQLPDHSRLDPS